MKVPGFLHQDPNDPSRMFLIGMWTWRASVVKFAKRNAGIDWKLEIDDGDKWNTDLKTIPTACKSTTSPCTSMNEILSYVQPKKSNMLFMCGWAYFDPQTEAPVYASMFKMDD